MIGIYGGSFNPVHYGHLRTALEIKDMFALDEIRFIPCYQSVLKKLPSINSSMRLAMLQLATAEQQGLICDSRELDRKGTSYMIDTLISLRDQFPQKTLALLIGSDAFLTLRQWHHWQKLFDYAHLIVMTRPKSNKTLLLDFFKTRLANNPTELKHSLAGKLYFQPVTQLAISSTQIRKLLITKGSPRFLMPDNVIDYIYENKLYRNLNANP